MNYETATLEELQAEFVRLAGELVTIENARNEILKQMEFRKRQAAARARVSAMSDAEKEALRAELQ
jgi:hypothetical protein